MVCFLPRWLQHDLHRLLVVIFFMTTFNPHSSKGCLQSPPSNKKGSSHQVWDMPLAEESSIAVSYQGWDVRSAQESPIAAYDQSWDARSAQESPIAVSDQGWDLCSPQLSPIAVSDQGWDVRSPHLSPIAVSDQGWDVRSTQESPIAASDQGLDLRSDQESFTAASNQRGFLNYIGSNVQGSKKAVGNTIINRHRITSWKEKEFRGFGMIKEENVISNGENIKGNSRKDFNKNIFNRLRNACKSEDYAQNSLNVTLMEDIKSKRHDIPKNDSNKREIPMSKAYTFENATNVDDHPGNLHKRGNDAMDMHSNDSVLSAKESNLHLKSNISIWLSRKLMTFSDITDQKTETSHHLKPTVFRDLAVCVTKECQSYIPQKSCNGKCNSVDNIPCSCHSSCLLFDQCCHDFSDVCPREHEKAQDEISRRSGIGVECDSILNYMFISHCPMDATEIEKKMCGSERTISNITTVVPVVDNKTLWHFKNVFCWRCWKMSSSFQPWVFYTNLITGSSVENATLPVDTQLKPGIFHRSIMRDVNAPVYSCPTDMEGTLGNCTVIKSYHPDLGEICQHDKSHYIEGSCQGYCNSTKALPCSCQPQCILHETCCDDLVNFCPDNLVEGYKLMLQYPRLVTSCDDILRIPVISNCPNSATAIDEKFCHSRDPFMPQSFIPVTDSVTHWQFKNIFCWECWKMKGNAIPWDLRVWEDFTGYSLEGLTLVDRMVYVLENHELHSYWFPPSNYPRHTCFPDKSPSRSCVTCFIRQFYSILPIHSQCANCIARNKSIYSISIPEIENCVEWKYITGNRTSIMNCLNCIDGLGAWDFNSVLNCVFCKTINETLGYIHSNLLECRMLLHYMNKKIVNDSGANINCSFCIRKKNSVDSTSMVSCKNCTNNLIMSKLSNRHFSDEIDNSRISSRYCESHHCYKNTDVYSNNTIESTDKYSNDSLQNTVTHLNDSIESTDTYLNYSIETTDNDSIENTNMSLNYNIENTDTDLIKNNGNTDTYLNDSFETNDNNNIENTDMYLNDGIETINAYLNNKKDVDLLFNFFSIIRNRIIFDYPQASHISYSNSSMYTTMPSTSYSNNYIQFKYLIQTSDMLFRCPKIIGKYLLSFCPEGFSADKDKCENSTEEVGDADTLIPVTDSINGVHFRNRYCWRCWGSHGRPIPWSVAVFIHRTVIAMFKINSMQQVIGFLLKYPMLALWKSPTISQQSYSSQFNYLDESQHILCQNHYEKRKFPSSNHTDSQTYQNIHCVVSNLINKTITDGIACQKFQGSNWISRYKIDNHAHYINVSLLTEGDTARLIFSVNNSFTIPSVRRTQLVCEKDALNCNITDCAEGTFVKMNRCINFYYYSHHVSFCRDDKWHVSTCSPEMIEDFRNFLKMRENKLADINPKQNQNVTILHPNLLKLFSTESEEIVNDGKGYPYIKIPRLLHKLKNSINEKLKNMECYVTAIIAYQEIASNKLFMPVYFVSTLKNRDVHIAIIDSTISSLILNQQSSCNVSMKLQICNNLVRREKGKVDTILKYTKCTDTYTCWWNNGSAPFFDNVEDIPTDCTVQTWSQCYIYNVVFIWFILKQI